VTAERSVLAALDADCFAVVGALADVVSDLDDDGRAVDRLSLRAVAATAEGALVRASATAETKDAEELGRAVAGELLVDGAVGRAGPAVPQQSTGPGEPEGMGPDR
jgi:hydroxymethylbilane synthase